MAKKIIVTVPLDGEMTVESKGYIGASCKDATKFLEAMGEKVDDKNTAEFYMTKTGTKAENKA